SAPLLADLADADPKIRRAAMREVVREREVDPQLLLKAARDPDIGVGVLAIDALGRMHAAGTVPAAELIQLAADSALNERVRLTAINGFGQVASAESGAYLADRLANGTTFERLNSAILIGHQDLEVAVPALIRALGDSEERVRANALETLRTRSRGRDFGTDAAAWQAWWQSRPQ
ncbi:MAG: HEAT repeat domain-containing protein, partial [Deltaproteobacteria bacterium]|nr:HEAT repeat domain-containing protein [Deltaproteobacteria bacterium]